MLYQGLGVHVLSVRVGIISGGENLLLLMQVL